MVITHCSPGAVKIQLHIRAFPGLKPQKKKSKCKSTSRRIWSGVIYLNELQRFLAVKIIGKKNPLSLCSLQKSTRMMSSWETTTPSPWSRLSGIARITASFTFTVDCKNSVFPQSKNTASVCAEKYQGYLAAASQEPGCVCTVALYWAVRPRLKSSNKPLCGSLPVRMHLGVAAWIHHRNGHRFKSGVQQKKFFRMFSSCP